MNRTLTILALLAAVPLAPPAPAQQDRLQGRWQGMVRSPLGERQATITLKREGETYIGGLSGLTGTTELPFKEFTIDGDKVTARMQVDAPQGPVVVDFNFALEGEALNGKAEAKIGTQTIAFTFEMKRIGDVVAKVEATPEQRLDYFVGEWKFEVVGRESPFSAGGTSTGTMRFKRVLGDRFVETRTECKAGGIDFQTSGFIGYDGANQSYTFFELLPTGIAALSTGSWVGPGIRTESAPIKLEQSTFKLRRTISIVSPTSFTLRTEFLVDDQAYQRLGNGVFTKVVAPAISSPR